MWKYVVFYVFYYNGSKYEGRLFHNRSTPITTQEAFEDVELSVKDTQKCDYIYGIKLIVTGFILLNKPSLLVRVCSLLTRKGETK